MLKRFKIGNYRGDTIVEVIVVLAVLGLAISISYATAYRSLLDARQAQEASQGTELIQSQLESLRSMAANPQTVSGSPNPDYLFPPAHQPFCVTVTSGTAHAQTGAACTQGIYTLNTTYTAKAGGPGGTFTIVASWDDVEGLGTDTATLNYNLYPTSP